MRVSDVNAPSVRTLLRDADVIFSRTALLHDVAVELNQLDMMSTSKVEATVPGQRPVSLLFGSRNPLTHTSHYKRETSDIASRPHDRVALSEGEYFVAAFQFEQWFAFDAGYYANAHFPVQGGRNKFFTSIIFVIFGSAGVGSHAFRAWNSK